MANIARLGVVLGLDTADFVKGLESAKRGLESLSGYIADAEKIAAVAFTGMVYKALQFSNQMSDLSDATEIGVASILKISDALEMSGGHADDATKMLSKFTQNIDVAAQGSKPMQDAFARIGVSLKDLKNLSNEQLFDKTTKGIANLGDVAARTGIAVTIMGRGIKGVDMVGFNALVQEASDKYQKYADAVKLTADMHDKLAQKTTMLMLSFTTEVMPVITQMFDTMSDKGGVADTIFTGLKYTLIGMWDVFGNINDMVQRVIVNWHAFNTNTMQSGEHLNALNDILLNTYNREKKLNDLRKEQVVKPYTPMGSDGRTVTKAKDPEAEKMANMLAMAKLLSVEYERQEKFSLQQLVSRNAMAAMTTDQARVQTAINASLDQTSKKIDEITKKREEAAGRGADQSVLDEYDRQIAKVTELGDAYVHLTAIEEANTIAQQRTFAYGWNKAFNQYAEDAYNYGKMGADSFNVVTNSMSSAIDNFVQNGKFAFGDFVKSVLQGLLKIQMQYLAMQMFSQASSGLGSMLGGLGGLFGGGGGSAATITDYSTPFTGMATGGEIDAPRLVGENGPEIFMPQRSGTIIPNNNIGDALGGGQAINYNGPYIAQMNAMDTQSATQFLAKNKTAVWAANQSAGRSMPTSR